MVETEIPDAVFAATIGDARRAEKAALMVTLRDHPDPVLAEVASGWFDGREGFCDLQRSDRSVDASRPYIVGYRKGDTVRWYSGATLQDAVNKAVWYFPMRELDNGEIDL